MWPDIPSDLSALSNEELAALEDQLVAAFQENAPQAITAEAVAQLQTLADGVDRVRAEATTRAEAAAQIAEQVAGLAQRVLVEGDTDEGDEQDDDADDGEDNAGEGGGEGGQEADPGSGPASPTPPANPETGEAPAPTARAASARATLAAFNQRQPARTQPRTTAPHPFGNVAITAAAGIPGVQPGRPFRNMEDITAAIVERRRNLGPAVPGSGEERFPIARFHMEMPEERQLRRDDSADQVMRKIQRFSHDQGLVAAGGLCAPVAGYYDQLVIAEAHRPVRAALPTFGAERGGIRFNPPPKLSQITQGVGTVSAALDASGTTVADGATTSGSTTVTSATAAFTAADVGRTISGAGIPAGATITAVTNATTVVISGAATATATGVSITIGRGSKATFVVTCPAITEVDVQAIYTSVQFGNFLNRSFPEQVTAWTTLLAALSARTAEQDLLDGIAANSTAVTTAGLVGGFREVLARFGQAASGYRSRNRMQPNSPLTLLLPQWAYDMASADAARTFTDEPGLAGMSIDDYMALLGERGVNVSFYADSKTGGNQVFAAQAAGVLNQFPAIMYGYLFAEGSFIRLDAGTLDLGIVRDSTLNAQNNFRMFSELWENVAFVGVESLEVALTSYPDGTYGAAKTVTVPITT